jgi:uncharacterized ParB-like nuclease family protein
MAEAAALVISVSSVISIFQSCYHTYKALNNALGMQHAVEGMDLELRIEEMNCVYGDEAEASAMISMRKVGQLCPIRISELYKSGTTMSFIYPGCDRLSTRF